MKIILVVVVAASSLIALGSSSPLKSWITQVANVREARNYPNPLNDPTYRYDYHTGYYNPYRPYPQYVYPNRRPAYPLDVYHLVDGFPHRPFPQHDYTFPKDDNSHYYG
ncbi:unnamed protein product [Meganyctiphanes norvegica]|uniref:Uncharacterized protein n=1 Tax=Meganyctiphanes norvegica TaxID=48144 RepID=A0AAV2R8D2_MEGNR